VVDVLHSRVASDPDWGPQVKALRDICRRPRLVNRWPPPDVPDPALRRALYGHTGGVNTVGVAPDGSWLASGEHSGSVRIWDVASGQTQALMRLDNSLNAITWVNTGALAIGGSAGLYLFDFLIDASHHSQCPAADRPA
jgi:WD40 repeat protein